MHVEDRTQSLEEATVGGGEGADKRGADSWREKTELVGTEFHHLLRMWLKASHSNSVGLLSHL